MLVKSTPDVIVSLHMHASILTAFIVLGATLLQTENRALVSTLPNI